MDTQSPGSRKGSRRAETPARRSPGHSVLVIGAAAVLAVLAWAVLVYAGIRFGQSARGGEGRAWVFMAIASIGAVACLFLALVLGSRTARLLRSGEPKAARPVAVKGGKRRR